MKSERSRGGLLVSVLLGLLSTNITFTIFNVALVDIAHGLHTTSTTLTWAITGPLLVVGVSAPLLGRLGDLRGHRRLFLIGMTGSLVCAAITALSWNAGSLIAARLLSGVGSASLSASSWALLFRVFDGPGERTKVMGWWSLVGAGGPVIGVAIGGPVVQAFGWRWIFVAQVPLIISALVWCRRTLPETERITGESLDVPGALLLALTVGSLLLAINQSSGGWMHPIVYGPVIALLLALPAFVIVERRAASPVLPLEWFGRRDIVLPCAASFFLNFGYMGGFFLTPLFLEQALHYSVGETGFFQIARPLVFAIAAPVAGYLAVWTGERAAAAAGGFALVLSMLVFAVLGPGSSSLLIVVALGASGLANGIAAPSISATVAGAVDRERLGSASATMQVASQVGVVVGIQVMETIEVARQHHASVMTAYHTAYLAGGAVAFLAVVASVLMRPASRMRWRIGRASPLGAEAAVETG
ncbi:MAG TPA: MFS transporter [Acidimicrobiales bacterium]|nr:MFS transporter [Acidimicrobiales bacterium]